MPDLLVERLQGDSTCWTKSLVKVDDDLESRYLRAQRSHLEFELSVPNHGECSMQVKLGLVHRRVPPGCSLCCVLTLLAKMRFYLTCFKGAMC